MSEITEKLRVAIADRYVIEQEAGQGGMATVYLAHDVKHDRKVALKVLRPELAAVIGAERFLQEIKVTANLQHSHILPLYDSGAAEGFLYYVMPYVEGETLRTRIDREKQLGVEDAVALTRAVAAALEHAHKQGIIHRDIKPENILLRDNDPLIADFGIALALSHAGGHRLTETGLSIGTPHYMSPEQAMGDREMDARSDVYSLGVMLYEMLVGDPPYTGSTAQAIVAKVITEKAPSVTSLRDTVPHHVSMAISKALAKLPADRFPSAASFAEALARPGMMDTTEYQSTAPEQRPSEPQRSRVAWAGWGLAAALAVVAGWLALRPVAELPVSRFSIVLPAAQRLSAVRGTRIALSPDGSRLAYIGTDEAGSRVWVRRRDQLSATPLPGTETAVTLFFAPDGRRIGFIDAGQRVHTVSLSGGPPNTLADTAVGLDGASWSADGYVYFDGFTGGGTPGLRRVPEGGGDDVVVTTVDTAGGEVDHIWPTALPDGRGVLFVVTRDGGLNSSDIAVLSPAGAYRVLVRGVAAAYAPSGHLLYVTSDGSLMAAPFDLGHLEVIGEAIAIGTSVGVRAFGATDLAVSGEGMVAYVTGGQASDPDEVVWVSPDGEIETIDPDWSGSFQTLAVSPDGRRLAISVQGNGEEQLWMKELPRGPITKLSFEGTLNYRPAWMPGARSVSYISNRAGRNQLLSVRAEGGATPEVVLDIGDASGDVQEGLWIRDGTLIYRRTPRDIYARTPAGDTLRLVVTPFEERGPALSPDGRWLAYQSDESGRYEVYVRPFPDAAAGRWQVSTDGGVVPRWSPDGQALYFVGPQDMMMVEALPGAAFTMGRRRPLFSRSFLSGASESSYDVAPDGRFVMIRSRAGGEGGELVVIENIGRALRPATP